MPLGITTSTSGLDGFRKTIETAEAQLDAALPSLAEKAGRHTVDYARYLMKLPKTGNPRKSKDGSGRIMIGSAPGEAPAIDTSKLYVGLNFAVRDYIATVNRYEPTPYGAYLEEPEDPKKARPFMQPAHDEAAKAYIKNLEKLLGRIF